MIAKDLRRLIKLYIKILAPELPPPHTEYMAEAILYLATKERTVSQSELVNHLEVDKRSLIPMLQELATLHYITIEPDPTNGNRGYYCLTDSGITLIPKIQNAIKLANEKLMGEMSKDDFETLLLQIGVIEANLKKRMFG